MPQTRFVLRHAIDTGLKIMIVINKIDRPGANPEKAYNDCLDLMADLGATDDQLEFCQGACYLRQRRQRLCPHEPRGRQYGHVSAARHDHRRHARPRG